MLSRSSLFAEALTRLTARAGKDALKDFDGFLFLYAGEQVATNRGGLYYPHAGSVLFQEQRRPYVLGPEGGSRMVPIGTFVKELGLVLGLPDLAARPEDPGSEGLGVWCAMSNTLGGSRPQHLCAWCKEKLGWVKPVILDPTVKQKVILAPWPILPGSASRSWSVPISVNTSFWKTGVEKVSMPTCRARDC